MDAVLPVLQYIAQLVFFVLLIMMITRAISRLIRKKSNYYAGEIDQVVEFCGLTLPQTRGGSMTVRLGHGTYAIGTSAFSELRILNAGAHFAGMLEVFETGECRLYVNSGYIFVRGKKITSKSSDYEQLFPGDVFTVGSQTCSLSHLDDIKEV